MANEDDVFAISLREHVNSISGESAGEMRFRIDSGLNGATGIWFAEPGESCVEVPIAIATRSHSGRGANMTSPMRSLTALGGKVWLDSVDPEEVVRNKNWGATGAASNPIIVANLIKTGKFD